MDRLLKDLTSVVSYAELGQNLARFYTCFHHPNKEEETKITITISDYKRVRVVIDDKEDWQTTNHERFAELVKQAIWPD